MMKNFRKVFFGATIAILMIFGGALSAKAESGIIKVISPNGGEKWQTGKAQYITWSMVGINKPKLILLWNEADGSPSSQDIATIDYSSPTDSAGNPYVKPANNQYTYGWYIPENQTLRSNYRIQISDASKQYIDINQSGVEYDTSDNYFSIVSNPLGIPAVEVVSPNGGEQWVFGDTVKIIWKRNWMPDQANGFVTLAIKKGNEAPFVLAQNVPDAAGYSFNISTSVFIHGYDYKIIVISNGYGANLSDESNNYFSIVNNIIMPTPAITPVPTPAPVCFLPDGTLVKLPGDPKIYVIKDCQKIWIKSVEEFNHSGYKWSDVNELPSSTVNSIPNISTVTPTVSPATSPLITLTPTPTVSPSVSPAAVNIPEGALIQVGGDPDVYIVKYVGNKKFKRLILSPSVFNSYGHLKWGNIIKVDKSLLDSFTASNLVRSENGSVYQLSPSGDTGIKNHVKDMTAFKKLGFDADSVYQINTTDENSYSQGQELR